MKKTIFLIACFTFLLFIQGCQKDEFLNESQQPSQSLIPLTDAEWTQEEQTFFQFEKFTSFQLKETRIGTRRSESYD